MEPKQNEPDIEQVKAEAFVVKPKIIHKAAKLNQNGDASALCFKMPRPINLKKESWTIVPELVTCGKCLKLQYLQQNGHKIVRAE